MTSAVGDVRPHDDLFLPAVVVQQRLEGRQRHHVKRGALLPAQLSERGAEAFGEREVQVRAAETLRGRARAVGREPQLGHAVQLPRPVGEVSFERLAL
jgi:hypothetical protein